MFLVIISREQVAWPYMRLGVVDCLSAPWVFNNDNGSASNCASNCANNCANNLQNDNPNNHGFRAAVFGSLGSWGTKVLLTCGTKCANAFQTQEKTSVSEFCAFFDLQGGAV